MPYKKTFILIGLMMIGIGIKLIVFGGLDQLIFIDFEEYAKPIAALSIAFGLFLIYFYLTHD
ncbi:MAG: hypothetical protein ACRBDX_00580 [Gammaproteobacteria bacterium]